MSQTRRRRWLSYSLRSLFVLTTLVAIGSAWVASERRQSQRELRIAEQLKASGSTVQLAGLFDSGTTVGPLSKEKSWWRRALGHLLGPRVKLVRTHGNPIDLSWLGGLKLLDELNLDGTQVSDLAPLAGLKNPTRVHLNGTQVGDLSPLAGLKSLQILWLGGTQLSDLSPLGGLKNLQVLMLTNTQVGNLTPLVGLNNLRALWLLDGTQVSDLSPLSELTLLQELHLEGIPVADEQVSLLQQALPNCRIIR